MQQQDPYDYNLTPELQQPQPPNYPSPDLAKVSESSDVANEGNFMKWQITPSDVLIEIAYNLRGFAFDEGKEQWIKLFDPQMSERGIQAILSRLKFYVNKNWVLTSISDEDIRKLTMAFADSLIVLFKNNWEEFGIEKTKLTSITTDIVSLVFATLQRAKEGKTLQHLETIERVNTIMREGIRNPSQDLDQRNKSFSLRRLFPH